jgi:hypothetical protein
MSLAIKQLIATYEDQVATNGMTPQLEIQLERLRAQLQTDEVGRAKVAEREATEAASAAKKAAKKGDKPLAAPTGEPGKHLTCRDCNYDFFLKDSQSAFFLEKGMSEPTRCFGCRQERKAARFMLPCLECETEFEFTPADQTFYAQQGWGQPKRCVTCRANKLQPQSLCCIECKKGFNFSVDSQKYFKAQGWKAPPRCHFCREAKKALKNVVPLAEAQAFATQLAASDAEALRVVEEAFAEGAGGVDFGFALPEGSAPAIFSGSAASAQ